MHHDSPNEISGHFIYMINYYTIIPLTKLTNFLSFVSIIFRKFEFLFTSIGFPVGARPSHANVFKNGSDPCLHGTHDEATMKHNWSAQCQYNVTGSVGTCVY